MHIEVVCYSEFPVQKYFVLAYLKMDLILLSNS